MATAGAGGALASATWLLARETHRQWRLVAVPAPASLDEAVTVLATALALVLCLWLATSTVVALLAHLPGRLGDRASRVAQVLSPALTRRVAAVLVGAAVSGALAPASALGDGSPRWPPPRRTRRPRPALGDGWGATRTRIRRHAHGQRRREPVRGHARRWSRVRSHDAHLAPDPEGGRRSGLRPPPDPWSAPR